MDKEKMEGDPTTRSFMEVLKELAESSSVHGIPKIASSRQMPVKVLWCILMFAGFCILTLQLLALFNTFTSHPVQTTVSLEFSTLRFPAVSFCNMNPVRKSKIGMSAQLRDTVYPKRKKYSVNQPENGDGDSANNEHVEEHAVRQKRELNSENATNTPKGFVNEVEDAINETSSGDYETIGIDTEDLAAQNETSETTITPPQETSTAFSYDYDERYVWDIFDYYESENQFNLSSANLSIYHDNEVEFDLAEHYSDPKDKWEELITKFKATFRNISVEKRMQMGHQLTDFVQQASFERREQNISKYFHPFTTSKYGNCFTIDHKKYKAWGSGPDSGIKLTLYLEVDEYIENFSSGYGVRIVFHDVGTLPMPAEEGLTLSPGYETSIGLRAINVTRLGAPYGECTASGSDRFMRKYNMTYGKTACLALCRVENVITECGCIPYDAPDINFKKKRPICGTNPFDEFCVDYVDNKFERGALGCQCISPCSEFVYSKTMSGRDWPHKDYLEKVLMKDICAKNVTSLKSACQQVQNESIDFNYERYKHNFVRVLIYFEDLNYEKITEEPFYTDVRFVSDIGGAVGLFMGVSLLSLFEILQFALEVVLYLYHRKRDAPADVKPVAHGGE